MLRKYLPGPDRMSCTVLEGAPADGLPAAAVWYDLVTPTREEELLVEAHLGLSVPTRDEMKDIEPSARLYTEAGTEFMTLTALTNIDKGDPIKAPITFVLRGKVLVTVRYADIKPFSLFENRAGRIDGERYPTGEHVMAGLIEAMIDRIAQVLETTGDELDAISREVFRRKTKSIARKTRNLTVLIERIGAMGDLLTLTRESLVSLLRLSTYHQAVRHPDAQNGRDLRAELKSQQRDASALLDHAGFLANKINFLLDATLGLINLEQNQIIKIFSIVAVVFLPPTLVASIYGMNFDFMPELGWSYGYPMALIIMVCSAILPFLFFKNRGWL